MRYVLIFISIIYVVIAESSTNSDWSSKIQKDKIPDTFLANLKLEHWDAEDEPCLNFTLEMLSGVKNSSLWATWIWDSMQFPSGVFYGSQYQLGSFDQCLKPLWFRSSAHRHLRTQYCLADVHLTDSMPANFKTVFDPYDSTKLYFNTASKYGKRFNLLTWGVCFSSRCTSHTLKKLVHAMLRTQHLIPTGAKEVSVHSCQVAGVMKQYGFGFKIYICLLLSLILVPLFSIYYLSHVTTDTLLTRLARSFCLKRNWNSLMTTNKDNIRVLDGIRFHSAIIIVILHYLSYAITLSVNNLDVEIDVDEKLLTMLIHLDIVVDTFLVLSGLLLVRSIVRHQQTGKGTLIRMLCLRYLRLLGPHAIMILYFACMSIHVGNGPLWLQLSKSEAEDCANNWWASLFMINNYVNTSKMCNMVSWYNSCDFQLAVLGTLFYKLYQKNRKVGLKCFMVAFLLSFVFPALVTYWHQMPAILVFNIEATRNFKENPVFLTTYIQTHNRAAVYLLGMALGHFMTIYNPTKYRQVIPKKLSLIGALIALVVMKIVLNYGAAMITEEYNQLAMATYVALNRIVWAVAICCLIVCCEYGTVPVIADYLSIEIAVPLGRLSYGVYMVHMAINYRILYSIRSPLSYNLINMVIGGLGVVTLSYIISCGMWHFIEAPLINVSNVLLDAI